MTGAEAERGHISRSREQAALEVIAECCRLCRADVDDLYAPFLRTVMRAFVVDAAAIYRPGEWSGEFNLLAAAGFSSPPPEVLRLGAPPPDFAVGEPNGEQRGAGALLRRELRAERVLWLYSAEVQLGLLVTVGSAPRSTVLDFSAADRPVLSLPLSAFAAVCQNRALQRELLAQHQRYQVLAESLHDIVFALGMDLRISYVSESVTRVIGLRPRELVGRPVAELLAPESRAIAQQALAEELAAEEAGEADADRSRTLELQLLTKSGALIWSEVTVRFVRDETGRATGIAGVARDVTKRRRAEEALRRSEERLALALEAANEGLWDWQVKTGEAYFSPRYMTMLGYAPDELPHSYATWAGLLHPEDRERAERHVANCVQNGVGFDELQFRMRTKSGEYRWILSRGQVIERDETGTPVRMVGTHVDITALKHSEASLRQSKETAWALLNATHDLAALLDREYRIVGINQAMARRFGTTPQQLLGRNILELLPPDIRHTRQQRLAQAIRTGEPVTFEDSRDGIHFANAIYPVRGEDNQVHHVAVFVQDVTERHRAEQTRRLASLGQLAAGVAHEFNNILAGIMLTMERAHTLDTPAAYQEMVERVRALAERGARIAGNLSDFARPGEEGRRPLAVEGLLDSALGVTTVELLQAGVVLDRSRADDALQVLGNPAELGQVFVELILNACAAMPEGGTLSISTWAGRDREGREAVFIRFSDTGTGIAPEHLPHIFEPFFTTRGVTTGSRTAGTGLGLSVAHGIITSHEGWIEVESEVGLGTTFTIALPALTAPQSQQATEREAAPCRDGHRVLVSEDEPDIAGMVAEVLRRQGYVVEVAAEADQAIRLLTTEHYDLLITDLLMPGGGESVLEAAARREPRPRLMVITGYIGDDLQERLRAAGVDQVLKKPFGVFELLRAVEELCGGNGRE